MKKADIMNSIFKTLDSKEGQQHIENLFGDDASDFIDWLYDMNAIKKLDFSNMAVEIYFAENNIIGLIEDLYPVYVSSL